MILDRTSSLARTPDTLPQPDQPAQDIGAGELFWRAAVDSAVQKPMLAVAELADHLSGSHLADSVQIVEAAPKPKGAVEENCQMVGSALGSLVPVGLSALASRFGISRLMGGKAAGAMLTRGTLGLNMAEAAATGLISGGLLTPTADASKKSLSDLLLDRGVKAGLGAASFTAMTAINAGLTSKTAVRALSTVGLSKAATNPILSGVISGIPAGAVNTQLESRVNRGHWADTDETLAGVYQMSLTGGVFGGASWLARSIRPTTDEQTPAQKESGVPAPEQPIAAAPLPTVPSSSHVEAAGKIVHLFDNFSIGTGSSHGLFEFKRAAAVSNAIKALPLQDRYPVWRALLQQSASDRDYSELSGIIARPIDALPDEHRFEAWNDLASTNGFANRHALQGAIQHLPKENRMAALETLLDRTEGKLDTRMTIPYLPADALPRIAERFFKMPQTEGDFLSRFAPLLELANWTQDIQKLPVADRAALVEKVFNAGLQHGGPGDEQVLNEMWANLPEPPPHDSLNSTSATPIRDYLMQKFSPEDLSKVAFSWADPEVVRPFAQQNPDVIRALAARPLEKMNPDQIKQAELIMLSSQTQKSLSAIVHDTFEALGSDLPQSHDMVVPRLFTELAARAPIGERIAALELAQERFFNSESATTRDNAYKVASFIGAADPQSLQKYFLGPISNRIASPDIAYIDKLQLAGRISAMQRYWSLPNMDIHIPDLRLPKQDIAVADRDLPALRQSIESDLQTPEAHGRMLNVLGHYFPKIFGDFEQFGGITGRPQHGIHNFPLHEHSLYVVEHVLKNPELSKLSSKDRTNLLWAALMHDAGKRANVHDPGHEWASANLSWGVLKTLGYPAERVQRIAALISRHQEASYAPGSKNSERLKEPERLDDLATFYRHPSAPTQLKILNESDIRSIAADSQYFKPDAAAEVERISLMLGQRAAELSTNSVPILTTALPSRFKLSALDGPYALLAHVSHYLDSGDFLKQLALIESPEYSISASLVTEANRRFYGGQDRSPLVILVSGPYENVSQAWRNNLGTGTRVNWQGHVELTKKWADGADKYQKGNLLARELDERARRAGIQAPDGDLAALHQLRDTVAQYDTLDELLAEHGADSPMARAVRSVIDALNEADYEQPSRDYNEVKLNSPTVVGIGINREGAPVYLENLNDSTNLEKLLGGQEKPQWLVTGAVAPPAARVVPEAVWRQALSRDLPLVVLDP